MTDFSGSVINQPSTDAWQVLRCPGAEEVIFTVANAGIVFQFGDGTVAVLWSDVQNPLMPGFHVRDQRSCDAVRFKSLKAGDPAQVSIEVSS
jgi:hypothetical protein